MQYQGEGYGLRRAAQGFFDTYFKAKQLRMQEEQYKQNFAEEQRQFSLLQAYRDAQLQIKQDPYENFTDRGYWDRSQGEPQYKPNPYYAPQNTKDSFENFSEKGYWDKSSGTPQWVPNPSYKEKPSEISQLNNQLKLEKIQEGSAQKQELYNSLMDSWDENQKAYVVQQDGNELYFKTDKDIERYAKQQVIKTKLPGKVNMWSRGTKNKTSNNTGIKSKYKDAYNSLINKGYSEQEAIDLIKKNEGI